MRFLRNAHVSLTIPPIPPGYRLATDVERLGQKPHGTQVAFPRPDDDWCEAATGSAWSDEFIYAVPDLAPPPKYQFNDKALSPAPLRIEKQHSFDDRCWLYVIVSSETVIGRFFTEADARFFIAMRNGGANALSIAREVLWQLANVEPGEHNGNCIQNRAKIALDLCDDALLSSGVVRQVKEGE